MDPFALLLACRFCVFFLFSDPVFTLAFVICAFLIFYLFLLDFVGLFFFSLLCPLFFSFVVTVLYLYSSILPALLAILLDLFFMSSSPFFSRSSVRGCFLLDRVASCSRGESLPLYLASILSLLCT